MWQADFLWHVFRHGFCHVKFNLRAITAEAVFELTITAQAVFALTAPVE